MSALSIATVPLSEEVVQDFADTWARLGTEDAEDELTVSGTRYLLFSEDALHKLIKSVIQDVSTPSED
jgi:hypothetical protein